MKRRFSKYLLLITSLFDIFIFLTLFKGGSSLLVQTKYSIFSRYEKLIAETELEKKIENNFKHYNSNSKLFKNIASEEKAKLKEIQRNSYKGDCIYLKNKVFEPTIADCNVYGLLSEFMPSNGGKECGLKGDLRTRLKKVYSSIGCCSDFSESFLAYSLLAGLKVREVYYGGHITAEYYDIETQSWKWIDPQYKQQIELNGEILSAYKIYKSSIAEDLKLLDPLNKNYNSPYLKISDRNMVGYVLGNNIFQIDEFEQRLNVFLLPKPFIQIISHNLGVRPSYLNIRLNSDTNLQKFYKFLNITIFLMFFLLNAASFFVLVVIFQKWQEYYFLRMC